MRKQHLFIMFLSLFLLSSCRDENRLREKEIAKLPFSPDYGFASQYAYKDSDSSFEFKPLLRKALLKEGMRDPDLYLNASHSVCKAYQNSMYFFSKVIDEGVLYYAAIKIDVTSLETTVMDLFSVQSLRDKGLVADRSADTSEDDYFSSDIINAWDEPVSFELDFSGTHLRFTYDPITLEKTYEGAYVKDPTYDEGKINDEYSVVAGDTIYDYYHSLPGILKVEDKAGKEWDVVKTLRESDIYAKIKEIYSDVHLALNYSYCILDEELYFEAEFNPTSVVIFDSKSTATMVFKADLEHQSVEYLGYLSVQNLLMGIYQRAKSVSVIAEI